MQTTLLRPLSALLFAGLLMLVTAGCETTSGATGTKAAQQGNPSTIRLGMSPAQVTEVMGESGDQLPLESLGTGGFEWQYKLFLSAYVGSKPTELVHTPYVDPFTGEMGEILDPVYRPEYKDVRRKLRIYFLEDEVVGWSVEDYSEMRYD